MALTYTSNIIDYDEKVKSRFERIDAELDDHTHRIELIEAKTDLIVLTGATDGQVLTFDSEEGIFMPKDNDGNMYMKVENENVTFSHTDLESNNG